MSQEKILQPFFDAPRVTGADFWDRITASIPSPRHIGRAFILWHEHWQQRRALERLDDRLLADVGLTREQVSRETRILFY